MRGVVRYLIAPGVLVTMSSFVVMAEWYHFQTSDEPTNVNCNDHVTRDGVAVTAIACAYTCSRNTLCRGFVYKPDTLACTEIGVMVNNFPDRRCQAGIGDKFALKSPACDQSLVAEPGGVADNQLSESSTWCDVYWQEIEAYCNDTEQRYYSGRWARLNTAGGGWVAGYRDTNQYVQVDFQQPRIVSSVVLQARADVVQYVTSFKVLYSDDCSVFQEIVDGNGNSIFNGNRDEHETKTIALPERIEARCFRINPLTYVGLDISLRFDLIGCT